MFSLFTATKKKVSESVVLLDIGAGSVAGACTFYKEGEQPVLLYTRRLPIEKRKDESHEVAMLRALSILCNSLVREGSPALVRTAGNGSVDTILVSIGAPWQETSVRRESLEKKSPFTFTKKIAAELMGKTKVPQSKRIVADENIIGTILNGYETRNPFGKKAHRASVIILSSLIDQDITNDIAFIIRSAYHTERILSITDSSLRYQAISSVFPHEHSMLILDATGPITSIILIRRGLFIGILETPAISGVIGGPKWVQKVIDGLSELANLNPPLPRTIFLLAHASEAPALQKELSAADLNSLWLSDNPPTIVAVLASHLNSAIRQATEAIPDLPLLLMALYYQHRISE